MGFLTLLICTEYKVMFLHSSMASGNNKWLLVLPEAAFIKIAQLSLAFFANVVCEYAAVS